MTGGCASRGAASQKKNLSWLAAALLPVLSDIPLPLDSLLRPRLQLPNNESECTQSVFHWKTIVKLSSTTRSKMNGCPHSGKVKLLFSAKPIFDEHQFLFLFEALVILQHGWRWCWAENVWDLDDNLCSNEPSWFLRPFENTLAVLFLLGNKSHVIRWPDCYEPLALRGRSGHFDLQVLFLFP